MKFFAEFGMDRGFQGAAGGQRWIGRTFGLLFLLTLLWSGECVTQVSAALTHSEGKTDSAVLSNSGTAQTPLLLHVSPRNFPPKLPETRRQVVLQVSSAPCVDWRNLVPSAYEKTYALISEPEFLSQFSMKRGYRLEPFFPLLFPESEEAWAQAAGEKAPDGETLAEKRIRVEWDVNLTLHETYRIQFLEPLMKWCAEERLPLEYLVEAKSFVPAAFLLEEGLAIRQTCGTADSAARFLAASMASQAGRLTCRMEEGALAEDLCANSRPASAVGAESLSNTDSESFGTIFGTANPDRDAVLLVPERCGCAFFENFSFQEKQVVKAEKGTVNASNGEKVPDRNAVMLEIYAEWNGKGPKGTVLTDCISEFQMPYVTITLRDGGTAYPEVGFGPVTWRKIVLAGKRSKFGEETRGKLRQFEEAGGKIIELETD